MQLSWDLCFTHDQFCTRALPLLFSLSIYFWCIHLFGEPNKLEFDEEIVTNSFQVRTFFFFFFCILCCVKLICSRFFYVIWKFSVLARTVRAAENARHNSIYFILNRYFVRYIKTYSMRACSPSICNIFPSGVQMNIYSFAFICW